VLLYRAFEIRFHSYATAPVGKFHDVRWKWFKLKQGDYASGFISVVAGFETNHSAKQVCHVEALLDPQAFDFELRHLRHLVKRESGITDWL
jgi:hypothetical protein